MPRMISQVVDNLLSVMILSVGWTVIRCPLDLSRGDLVRRDSVLRPLLSFWVSRA